jgi:hypothetical protein
VEILTMRRHLLSFALALAAVGACTFPQASFQSGDDGSAPNDSGDTDRTTSSSSGGNDGSSSSSGGGDAMGDHATTDSAPDVTSSDSSSSSSGSSSGSDPCDKDNDTYRAKSCGGNDCCDTDPQAHPNQTNWFTTADQCMSFDYNCDTNETPEWQLFSCTVGVGCTATPGFVGGVPGCGVTAPWTNACMYMVTSCSAGATMSQQQACN